MPNTCPKIDLPAGRENLRPLVENAVRAALQIVHDFATLHRWAQFLDKPFLSKVEIYSNRDSLWKRILFLNKLDFYPPPTDALIAALESEILLAVTPEEARLARPEYFSTTESWHQALAHEVIHQLHIRILNGDQDAMGPQWFFEGFAIIASGQKIGTELNPRTPREAIELTRYEGRGSYAHYAAALRYFAKLSNLAELVARASRTDFEEWLISLEP